MADPTFLGVLSAIRAAITTAQAACDFIDGVRNGPEVVEALVADLESVESALRALDTCLAEQNYDHQSNTALLPMLTTSVLDCINSCDAITNAIKQFVHTPTGSRISRWKKTALVRYRDQDFLALQHRLSISKASLDIAVELVHLHIVHRGRLSDSSRLPAHLRQLRQRLDEDKSSNANPYLESQSSSHALALRQFIGESESLLRAAAGQTKPPPPPLPPRLVLEHTEPISNKDSTYIVGKGSTTVADELGLNGADGSLPIFDGPTIIEDGDFPPSVENSTIIEGGNAISKAAESSAVSGDVSASIAAEALKSTSASGSPVLANAKHSSIKSSDSPVAAGQQSSMVAEVNSPSKPKMDFPVVAKENSSPGAKDGFEHPPLSTGPNKPKLDDSESLTLPRDFEDSIPDSLISKLNPVTSSDGRTLWYYHHKKWPVHGNLSFLGWSIMYADPVYKLFERIEAAAPKVTNSLAFEERLESQYSQMSKFISEVKVVTIPNEAGLVLERLESQYTSMAKLNATDPEATEKERVKNLFPIGFDPVAEAAKERLESQYTQMKKYFIPEIEFTSDRFLTNVSKSIKALIKGNAEANMSRSSATEERLESQYETAKYVARVFEIEGIWLQSKVLGKYLQVIKLAEIPAGQLTAERKKVGIASLPPSALHECDNLLRERWQKDELSFYTHRVRYEAVGETPSEPPDELKKSMIDYIAESVVEAHLAKPALKMQLWKDANMNAGKKFIQDQPKALLIFAQARQKLLAGRRPVTLAAIHESVRAAVDKLDDQNRHLLRQVEHEIWLQTFRIRLLPARETRTMPGAEGDWRGQKNHDVLRARGNIIRLPRRVVVQKNLTDIYGSGA